MTDEESNLEQEFNQEFLSKFSAAMIKGGDKINEELRLAKEHLAQAVAISETYGIPFKSGISLLRNVYRPSSMEEIWGEANINYLATEDIDELDFSFPYYEGWKHSMVC